MKKYNQFIKENVNEDDFHQNIKSRFPSLSSALDGDGYVVNIKEYMSDPLTQFINNPSDDELYDILKDLTTMGISENDIKVGPFYKDTWSPRHRVKSFDIISDTLWINTDDENIMNKIKEQYKPHEFKKIGNYYKLQWDYGTLFKLKKQIDLSDPKIRQFTPFTKKKKSEMEIVINERQYFYKFTSLKNWLYRKDGLGMMYIIDNLLEPYKTNLSPQEIEKFNRGVVLLKKTGINVDKKLNYKLPGGIESARIVKVNGKWHPVNKLNTNYGDLSQILIDVIKLMFNEKNEKIVNFIKPICKLINTGYVKDGLLKLKPKLENIIHYYFFKKGDGFNEFLNYTDNVKKNSHIGEVAENQITNYLIDNGFELKYQGGDGDFIDMIFGTDIIVYREDFGLKTIQVKAFMPKQENVKYYDVDWIATTSGGNQIIDKNTWEHIKI